MLLRYLVALFVLLGLNALKGFAQTPEQNYVLTRTYKQTGAVEASGNTYSGTPTQVNTQLSYFDGLGQPTQQIAAFAGPSNQDLMSRTEYDNQLRASKAYEVISIANNNGRFVASPNGTYYNNQDLVCTPTTNYFTETFYEPSPMNRMGESRAPGVTTGVRMAYPVNLAGSVKRYAPNGVGLRNIQDLGTYNANTLTYTETKDEDNKTVLEYRDSYNRIILKRVKNDSEDLDTYYVYDEQGQVRAVLQPMYQGEGNLDKYAFLYEYDSRGRLFKKKVPGAGESTLYYDGRDRLMSMVDGNGRNFYYQYDELNRLIEMGVDNQPLVYTFYDNYSPRPNFGQFTGANFFNELGLTSGDHFVGDPQNDSRKGLVTGVTVRMLNPDGSFGDWKRSVTYYDSKGRVIQVCRQLYGFNSEASERISYRLDFLGRVAFERTTQLTGAPPVRVDKQFEYDQADRLTKIQHRIYENDVLKMDYTHSQLTYNEVGQLGRKSLHNGVQTLTFKYTPRGWVCDQRNDGGTGFNETLGYFPNGNIYSMDSGTNGQFGGTAIYAYDGANRLTGYQTGFGFKENNESGIGYDRNGNIKNLTRKYNLNPPIQPQSNPVVIDQLSFTYNGNQLVQVEDGANDGGLPERGFVNGANYNGEMGYDGNGNLTKDDNRGIGNGGIAYNVLNLPRQVLKSGQLVQYIYDATGAKRQIVAPGNIRTTYEGAFEYNSNGTLARIALEEGQLVRDAGGNYTVHYYIKDHLGNVRMVLKEDRTVLQQTEYYAFGLAIQRSGDLATNRYQYNGKEKQPETNWLDFGARMYDPTIGRWMTVDPMAEVARRWSTYAYVYNNPLRFIDPDGMMVDSDGRGGTAEEAAHDNQIQWTDGYGTYTGLGATSRSSLSGVYAITSTEGSSGQTQGGPGAKDDNTNTKSSQQPRPLYVDRNGRLIYPEGYQELAIKDGIEPSYFIEGQFIGGAAFKPIGWLFRSVFGRFTGTIASKTLTFEAQLVKKGIQGFTQHGADRMVERGFSQEAIMRIINEGVVKPVVYKGQPQVHYVFGQYTITTAVTGQNAGKIINVMGDYNTIGSNGIRGIFTGF